MKELRKGVIYTYIGMLVNTIYGFVITPLMLYKLGQVDYSIYQSVVSISGYLMVVNIGTGAAMTRFVTKYRSENDEEAENNYILINIIVTLLLILVVFIIGIIITEQIQNIYPKIIVSDSDFRLAKILCIIVTANVMINFLAGSLDGLLQAYGRVDISKSFSFFKTIMRFIFMYVLLKIGYKAIAVSLVDLTLVILYLFFMVYKLKRNCRFKIKFKKIKVDNFLLKETIMFSGASLLAGLSGQLNNNVDKIILGIYTDSFVVTVYTVATTFYVIFTSVGTCLNGTFLNKITEINFKYGNKELEDFNISIGRFQNLIVGCLFFGYICLGKDFITAWMGAKYLDIYIYALLLIIPNYFVCIGGVQTTILDAKNKKLFQSVMVFVIGIFNVILTTILVKKIGGIGAPIGTMISLILGYNIIANFYLWRRIGLNIWRMYAETLRGFLPVQIIVTVTSLLVNKNIYFSINNIWLKFIIEGISFMLLYLIGVIVFAFNKDEKNMLKKVIKKV